MQCSSEEYTAESEPNCGIESSLWDVSIEPCTVGKDGDLAVLSSMEG